MVKWNKRFNDYEVLSHDQQEQEDGTKRKLYIYRWRKKNVSFPFYLIMFYERIFMLNLMLTIVIT